MRNGFEKVPRGITVGNYLLCFTGDVCLQTSCFGYGLRHASPLLFGRIFFARASLLRAFSFVSHHAYDMYRGDAFQRNTSRCRAWLGQVLGRPETLGTTNYNISWYLRSLASRPAVFRLLRAP